DVQGGGPLAQPPGSHAQRSPLREPLGDSPRTPRRAPPPGRRRRSTWLPLSHPERRRGLSRGTWASPFCGFPCLGFSLLCCVCVVGWWGCVLPPVPIPCLPPFGSGLVCVCATLCCTCGGWGAWGVPGWPWGFVPLVCG